MTYKIIVVHGNLHYKVTTLSYLHCTHTGGSWSYSNELHKSIEVGFATTIQHITQLSITAYQELSLSVTHKLSAEIALFIQEHQLEHTIDWVAYNGIQVVDGLYLGNAALLAANIKLPVVAELYSMHQALLGNNDYLAVASLIAQVQPTYTEPVAPPTIVEPVTVTI